jgi:16S rRNA (cytosine1402-N4)-methyltransferase
MSEYHVPVMMAEVLNYLAPGSGQVIVDATLGGGGHAEAILCGTGPGGGIKKLIGIDRDPEALVEAGSKLKRFSARVVIKQGGFEELPRILAEEGIEKVEGVLLDLGVSRHQLMTGARGFGLFAEGPLDMRLDPREGLSAAELLAQADEQSLTEVLREDGEERHARRIARAILGARSAGHVPRTTSELRDLVASVVPAAHSAASGRIHPATRTFMALRIAVNRELEHLDQVLAVLPEVLADDGRAVVLSYHSLEDRRVKTAFAAEAKGCVCPPDMPQCGCGRKPRLRVLTRKPVTASAAEVQANPASRSAKLRAALRLPRAGADS